MMKRLFGICGFFFCLALSAALAKPSPDAAAVAMPDEERLRVEGYLNALTTFQADFIQISPDGSTATGRFYLSRPGKLRWDYHPPVPLHILVNGRFLIYYDEELGEVTHIPVEATLGSFLTRPSIRLSGDIAVTDFQQDASTLRVTVEQRAERKGGGYDGSLTLVFSDRPLQLRKMEVTDATGQTTIVALNNQRFDVTLDHKLFILENPKSFKKRH